MKWWGGGEGWGARGRSGGVAKVRRARLEAQAFDWWSIGGRSEIGLW